MTTRYQPGQRLPHIPRQRFARFVPRRTEDLALDVKEYVGQVFEVRNEMWVIDGGPYDGEMAIDLDWPPCRWVPSGDLDDVSKGPPAPRRVAVSGPSHLIQLTMRHVLRGIGAHGVDADGVLHPIVILDHDLPGGLSRIADAHR